MKEAYARRKLGLKGDLSGLAKSLKCKNHAIAILIKLMLKK